MLNFLVKILGNIKIIRKYSLTHQNSELSYKCNHKIIVGQRYNKLLVLERKDENCICQCDCGNKKKFRLVTY